MARLAPHADALRALVDDVETQCHELPDDQLNETLRAAQTALVMPTEDADWPTVVVAGLVKQVAESEIAHRAAAVSLRRGLVLT